MIIDVTRHHLHTVKVIIQKENIYTHVCYGQIKGVGSAYFSYCLWCLQSSVV